MNHLILGIDPGQATGLAMVFVGAQAPFKLHRYATVLAKDLAPTLREWFQSGALDGVVIETWEWQGAARGRRIAETAEAVGYVRGIVATLRPQVPQAAIARTNVLAGLGLSARASKATCGQRVWTLLEDRTVELPEHVSDAAAAAIVGAGRLEGLSKAVTSWAATT